MWIFKGFYSALDGVRPGEFNIEPLVGRLNPGQKVILAFNAMVEGQTTDRSLPRRPNCRQLETVCVTGNLPTLDPVRSRKSRALGAAGFGWH
jgi:recombinational DNA repair protein RecR